MYQEIYRFHYTKCLFLILVWFHVKDDFRIFGRSSRCPSSPSIVCVVGQGQFSSICLNVLKIFLVCFFYHLQIQNLVLASCRLFTLIIHVLSNLFLHINEYKNDIFHLRLFQCHKKGSVIWCCNMLKDKYSFQIIFLTAMTALQLQLFFTFLHQFIFCLSRLLIMSRDVFVMIRAGRLISNLICFTILW